MLAVGTGTVLPAIKPSPPLLSPPLLVYLCWCLFVCVSLSVCGDHDGGRVCMWWSWWWSWVVWEPHHFHTIPTCHLVTLTLLILNSPPPLPRILPSVILNVTICQYFCADTYVFLLIYFQVSSQKYLQIVRMYLIATLPLLSWQKRIGCFKFFKFQFWSHHIQLEVFLQPE